MKKLIIFLPFFVTACQSNQAVIQQSARSLAAQAPQVANPPGAHHAPWIPGLIGVGIILVVLVISLFILWQRATRKAAYEQQRAALKAREARLQLAYQQKLAENILPPTGPPTQPYQPPQEPPRPW